MRSPMPIRRADPAAPFSSIEVRMIPENVTLVPKAEPAQQPTQMEERLVTVRRGESFEDVLAANNVPRDKIPNIVAALRASAPTCRAKAAD